jgi:hypothetical protein
MERCRKNSSVKIQAKEWEQKKRHSVKKLDTGLLFGERP